MTAITDEPKERRARRRLPRSRFGLWVGLISTIVAALLASGCGDDDPSGADEGVNGSATESASVEQLVEGTYEEPPASGPPPADGKSIVIVSCDQSATGCANAAEGAADAAASIGWDATVVDGKGDPREFAAAVDQAIVSNADGVFTYAIDCAFIKQPLQRAQSEGVPVVNAQGLDCDSSGGKPLFAGEVTYAEGPLTEWLKAYGRAQADYLIAEAGDDANVVAFENKELQTLALQQEAFMERMSECSACTVNPVEFTLADLGGAIGEKAKQALLKFPDATAIQVPTDAVLVAGVGAAIRSANRDLTVVAAEGAEPTIEFVQEGLVNAGIGIPTRWEGYSGVDALNRLFADDEPVSSGIGIQLYNAENNLPEEGGYEPPSDFEALYGEAWGG